ncbi:hypothetical protein [Psychromonas ingrahamii]|uniref:hypothetical protein n=1 Tax=Psychromonas ingrahamii TaxID=357794 RepID=UPI0005A0CC3D|nr:hypothetical protein [Psychromonas ingrahamii]
MKNKAGRIRQAGKRKQGLKAGRIKQAGKLITRLEGWKDKTGWKAENKAGRLGVEGWNALKP